MQADRADVAGGKGSPVESSSSVTKRLSDLEERSQSAESRISDLQMALAKEIQSSEAIISKMESRLSQFEIRLQSSSTQSKVPIWRRIGSNEVVEESRLPADYQSRIILLPTDVYSIVATRDWSSFAFWISLLVIFGFQFSLLVLLPLNLIGVEDNNLLGAPANVELAVRAAQALALVIALFSQGDLRKGMEGLALGRPTIYQMQGVYQGEDAFQPMSPWRWYFAYTVRSIQGLGSLFASFVLLIQAESVFDVLLNFLGVQFISDLDDLAFDLGLQGYFGASLQLMAKRITEARFLRDYPAPVKCFQGARRTYSNVIGMFVVLVVMVTIFSILAIDQDQGTYSIEYITAEFGDEVLPFLGLFNGCYRAKKQGPTLNRRLVYEQIGSEDLGGKFAYCNEIENGSGDKSEGWVFFKGISADFSCEDYILRSGSTNTFDIIDATSSQWYTKDGQLVDYLQVSELQVSELPAKFSSPFECGPRMFLSMIGSCDRVDTPVGFDSPLNGTRWVLATAEAIIAGDRAPLEFRNESRWNHRAVIDYFYNNKDNKGSRAIERIETSKQWVFAVSDVVDTTTDQGLPFALQWFGVRNDSSTNYSFPSVDLTRPLAATLGCARCGDGLAECAYEGKCVDGECKCKNRATGVLCKDAPLGDGICDKFFNKAEFNYDGGDCCASTCTGAFCGGNSLSVAFGVDLNGNTFEQQFLDGASVIGFENCNDPSMEVFTIELSTDEACFRGTWGLEAVNVICDGVVYLQTPELLMAQSADEADCNEDDPMIQHIHVPAGVSCELSRPLDDFARYFEISLFRGNSTDSPTILHGSRDASSLTWSEPSVCLQKVFTGYFGNTRWLYDTQSLQGRAIQNLAADGTSDRLCNLDEGLVLERYALSVFNVSVGLEATNWQVHQCSGWGGAEWGLDLDCNIDDRVVSIKPQSQIIGVSNTIGMVGGAIPSELFLLTHLSYIDLRSSKLTGKLPTEVGLLSNLSYLSLSGNKFTGTLPTEIGKLSNISSLSLGYTSYPEFLDGVDYWGKLPTEIGLLTNLSRLSLYGFLGGTLPTELFLLSQLTSLNLSSQKLTGTLPAHICQLTQLDDLNLSSNNLVGPLPTELGCLTKLEYLNLQNNQFTGSFPVLNAAKDFSCMAGNSCLAPYYDNGWKCGGSNNCFQDLDNALGCDVERNCV